tara:strand:+ start:840 stop:2657 length:1818 start_codon:yes stop_codon:yes gene_type:complete
MRKYDKGGPKKKKSIMFLDDGKNKNQEVNLNLKNFRDVKNPDLMNALTIGGGTLLGSAGIRNMSTNRKQNKAWKGAYSDFTGALGGQDWINQVNDLYCADGTCPAVQANLEKLLGSHDSPDMNWFQDESTNVLGKDYHMGRHNVLSKEDLRKQKTKNILKGGRDAVIAGGGSYLLNKALDNTKWGKKLQKKIGMDINLGIFREEGGQRAKHGGVKKYATAGMYDANVIPGSMNSTTNIVGAERDASILATNQQGMQSVTDKLKADNEALASEIGNIEATEDAKIQEAADKVGRGAETTMEVAGKGLKTAKEKGLLKGFFGDKAAGASGNINAPSLIDKSGPLFDKFKPTPMSELLGGTPKFDPASSLNKVKNLSIKTPSLNTTLSGTAPKSAFGNISLGADKLGGTLGNLKAATDVVDKVNKFKGLGTTGMEFGKLAAKGTQGAKLAAGAGKFLTSGAGLGTVATLAGKGISKLSDDNDATKSNVGEYSGSILSAAGTGASFGSMLGPVGTAVGAIGGAIYGAGKQFIGTRKAKQEKERLDADKKLKIEEYNEQLEDQMGSQLARARAGEMEQKTYSGYDLGRNVTYRLGGGKVMRGMPRYGYAA